MVVEVSTGNGFRSTISYVHKEHEKDLAQDKKPEIIEKNLVFGNTPEMARQMRFVSNANSRISKPVMHVSVSFDAKERISEEQRQQAVQSVLKEMGVKTQDHQYLIVKHNDTANPHYHIVLNKVDLDGKKLNLSFDGKKEGFIKNRLQVIADKIEQEQGLQRTSGRDIIYDAGNEKGYRFLTAEEKAERGQRRSKKVVLSKDPNKKAQQLRIQSAVEGVLQDKRVTTSKAFKESLEGKGIDVRFIENRNGIFGVSFKSDTISVKGSLVGAKWSVIDNVLTTHAILGKESEIRAYIEEKSAEINDPTNLVDRAIREMMPDIRLEENPWTTWNKNPESEKLYDELHRHAEKVLEGKRQAAKVVVSRAEVEQVLQGKLERVFSKSLSVGLWANVDHILRSNGIQRMDRGYVFSVGDRRFLMKVDLERGIEKTCGQVRALYAKYEERKAYEDKIIKAKLKPLQDVPLIFGRKAILEENAKAEEYNRKLQSAKLQVKRNQVKKPVQEASRFMSGYIGKAIKQEFYVYKDKVNRQQQARSSEGLKVPKEERNETKKRNGRIGY